MYQDRDPKLKTLASKLNQLKREELKIAKATEDTKRSVYFGGGTGIENRFADVKYLLKNAAVQRDLSKASLSIIDRLSETFEQIQSDGINVKNIDVLKDEVEKINDELILDRRISAEEKKHVDQSLRDLQNELRRGFNSRDFLKDKMMGGIRRQFKAVTDPLNVVSFLGSDSPFVRRMVDRARTRRAERQEQSGSAQLLSLRKDLERNRELQKQLTGGAPRGSGGGGGSSRGETALDIQSVRAAVNRVEHNVLSLRNEIRSLLGAKNSSSVVADSDRFRGKAGGAGGGGLMALASRFLPMIGSALPTILAIGAGVAAIMKFLKIAEPHVTEAVRQHVAPAVGSVITNQFKQGAGQTYVPNDYVPKMGPKGYRAGDITKHSENMGRYSGMNQLAKGVVHGDKELRHRAFGAYQFHTGGGLNDFLLDPANKKYFDMFSPIWRPTNTTGGKQMTGAQARRFDELWTKLDKTDPGFRQAQDDYAQKRGGVGGAWVKKIARDLHLQTGESMASIENRIYTEPALQELVIGTAIREGAGGASAAWRKAFKPGEKVGDMDVNQIIDRVTEQRIAKRPEDAKRFEREARQMKIVAADTLPFSPSDPKTFSKEAVSAIPPIIVQQHFNTPAASSGVAMSGGMDPTLHVVDERNKDLATVH